MSTLLQESLAEVSRRLLSEANIISQLSRDALDGNQADLAKALLSANKSLKDLVRQMRAAAELADDV